jgi:hypothetical protein
MRDVVDDHEWWMSRMRRFPHALMRSRCEESEWSLHGTTDGVQCWTRFVPESLLKAVRLRTTIAAPLDTVARCLMDHTSWNKWRTGALSYFRELEDVATRTPEPYDTARVIYMAIKPPMIDDRDFCVFMTSRKGTPNEPARTDCFMGASVSVTHSKAPEVSGRQFEWCRGRALSQMGLGARYTDMCVATCCSTALCWSRRAARAAR